MKNKIQSFIKAQPVLVIAFILAVISIFIVPPDRQYKEYINYTVLIQLFALMTAVAGLRQAGILDKATHLLLTKVSTVRKLSFIMILICWVSSMFLTNDVALITFVPLTLLLFSDIKNENAVILTVIAETTASNLGSMMTPFGNPQNLYIYNAFQLNFVDFVSSAVPVGIFGLVLSLLICLFIPKNKCPAPKKQDFTLNTRNTIVFAVLFLICIVSVFRILPVYVCLISALIAVAVTDIKLLSKVDYALLATFVCFFIFVGNLARISIIQNFFRNIMEGHEIIVSILLSQVISNVPASVMLSGFTEKGKELMLGVDIGGLGTLIASLASLISFQFYRKEYPDKSKKYITVFTLINFIMLFIIGIPADFIW